MHEFPQRVIREYTAERTSGQRERLAVFHGKGFRAVAFCEGNRMRLLTLHPDHDSAYRG